MLNGVEVLPTPGHSPGSVCYQVRGAEGTYLFTGDTLFVSDTGEWTAGFIPGISDADALVSSLELLATLAPDVVISSAFQGDSAVHRIDAGRLATACAPGTSPAPPGLANRGLRASIKHVCNSISGSPTGRP